MLFHFAHILFLLASVVIAAPPPTQLLHVGRSTSVEYNPLDSGAVLESFPSGTFQRVNATLAAPTLQGPVGSSGYAIIAIDGVSCKSAMLRVAVTFQVTQQGPQYQAWAQWHPDPSYNLGLDIAAGDRLHVTVVALTPLSGRVTIRNNRTGEKRWQHMQSNASLCMSDAGWYVVAADKSLPNFGEVVFDDAKAVGHGKQYMPEEAHLYDIKQDNQVLTEVSVSGATVTVKYV